MNEDWRLKMRTDAYYYLVFQGVTLLGGFTRKYEANNWLRDHPYWTVNDLNLMRVKGDDIAIIDWELKPPRQLSKRALA